MKPKRPPVAFKEPRIAQVRSFQALALLSITLFPEVSHAETRTWDGGGGGFVDWNNASNWNPDATPSSGDVLHFATTSNSTTLINNLDQGYNHFQVHDLIQDSGAPGFTLQGIRVFVQNGGSIVNNSSNLFTLQFDVNSTDADGMRLGDAVAVNAASGNILFAKTTNNKSVYFNGTITFNGGSGRSTTITNNIGLGGTTVVNTAALILSGNNSGYSGQINVENTATLQLQANTGNTDSGQSNAAGTNSLVLRNGSTLQLRSDSDVTFNGGNGLAGLGGATVTIDVNQLGSGNSNKTISLAPAGFGTSNTTINVTGGNGYALAIGSVNEGFNGALTLNAVSANLAIGAIGSNSSITSLTVGGTLNTTITGTINTSGSVTKNDTGTLTLTGTNAYTGATNVNGGKLKVSGSIGNSAVTVTGSGSTLASGTTGAFGGTVTINSGAILAVGDVDVIGAATVTSSTTLNSGSIFSWDLASTPTETGRGTSYDALDTASLEVTTGAIFRVVLNGSQDFGAGFWDSTRQWTDIFKNGGTSLDFASIFSGGVQYYNGTGELTSIPSTQGSFAMSGSTLTWTAVPEPTSALAGLLIGAGFLRRRRRP